MKDSARRAAPRARRQGAFIINFPIFLIFHYVSFHAFGVLPVGRARGPGLGPEASGQARGLDQTVQNHYENQAFSSRTCGLGLRGGASRPVAGPLPPLWRRQ